MVGWPGSVDDSRVLANSQLCHKAIHKAILHSECQTILGKDINFKTLHTWLMKSFTCNAALSSAQKTFNYQLSQAQIEVDNVFGHLKARWRQLMKQNDMDIPKFLKLLLVKSTGIQLLTPGWIAMNCYNQNLLPHQ